MNNCPVSENQCCRLVLLRENSEEDPNQKEFYSEDIVRVESDSL